MVLFKLVSFAVAVGCLCHAQDLSVQVKVVKGSPFSAQAVTENAKVLADGTHITQNTTAAIARDAEGRTRREQTLPNGSSIVFVQDPVTGFGLQINQNKKSVRRFVISTKDIKSVDAAATDGESLGTQLMDGIQAEGTRVTRKVSGEQGAGGSPLEIVIEAWYSNELQTTIMRKLNDPRVGVRTLKLTNIQRIEPDPSLFTIPAGYTIADWPPETSGKQTAKQ